MSRVAPLRFILPQLASPVHQPPEGEQWIHEIKYDGYRCQVLIEPDRTRVITRNGYDWSDRYPSIIRAALALRCESAIIDGEAIVQDSTGASDFDALNTAMHWRPESIILYAFDLMHLNGIDLRQRALADRRAILKALLRSDDESRIQFSDEFVGDGAALFKGCADRGLEGVVSKHRMAPYRSGRTTTWLKAKCFTESIFVVIGTDRDRNTGAVRALLAHNDGSGLNYAGATFIGLRDDERDYFFAELERLTMSWETFKTSRHGDAKWCQPELMVRVKHLAGSKTLRHATVRELMR
jgi:bifunctional non-homologous end joining protein LigD